VFSGRDSFWVRPELRKGEYPAKHMDTHERLDDLSSFDVELTIVCLEGTFPLNVSDSGGADKDCL